MIKNATAMFVLSLGLIPGSTMAWGTREGEKSECVKSRSTAWCLLDAANMTRGELKDVGAKDLEGALGKRPSGDGWWYATGIAAEAANLWRPTPGIGHGAMGGMLALSWLLGTSQPSAMGWNGVFGWMPLSEASSEQEAQVLAADALRTAMRRVFRNFQLTLEWEPDDRQKPAYRFDGRGREAYRVTGPGCDQRVCRLSVVSRAFPAESVSRPEWLGGGQAWGIAVKYGVKEGALAPWRFTIDGVDVTASYLQELSKELPPWAFIWVSAETKVSWGVANVGQRIPGVYRNGEFMPMVFPEPQRDHAGKEGSPSVSTLQRATNSADPDRADGGQAGQGASQ